MKKKLLAGMLAAALLCGVGLAAAGAEPHSGTVPDQPQAVRLAAAFSDVPADAWYAEAVSWCREHGVMNGTSSAVFSPDRIMTRAMFATVLYRAAGSPAVEGAARFRDVTAGSWCADAVAWAAANGIVNGYGNGLFGPNDPVTHEQTVAILWRYDGGDVLPLLQGSGRRGGGRLRTGARHR